MDTEAACPRCGDEIDPEQAFCPSCCDSHDYAHHGNGLWICTLCGGADPDNSEAVDA